MGIIISTTNSGFSNRVKSLVSIMGRKEKHRVFWYKNAIVETKFSDLFEDNSIEVFRAPKELFSYNQNYIPIFKPKLHFSPFFDLSTFQLGPYRAKPLYDGKKKQYVQINEGRSIDYMYNDAPKKITSIFRNRVRSLLPRKEIREAARGFVNEVLHRDFLGSHIRTWSSVYQAHNEPRRQDHFKPSEWVKLITERSNSVSSKTYIATDNSKAVQPLFQNKIKNIYYRNDLEKWIKKKGLKFDVDQFAFIEILVLSYSKELCVSLKSTFGELAWYYNVNPVDVYVI